ncbi:zinc ribbon-containing protein [Wolbachia endosymbiont of Ctenocephalides felis wCfeT]|uniref:hypothetical protein n=1 Tax=Wolbachia endosymbiont of Ctenocephalides felis wCfeT TaxID=2732593 RepID=UPI001445A88E|nr:hypothetical protein [Wolbachia endosymbiont of Ctenocephalides felis wCfeT]
MTETKFKKPEFIKPAVEKISTKTEEIDITKDMTKDEIKEIKAAVITVKHLKNFYDALTESMENYSNSIDKNIVEPLLSTVDEIGKKTEEIEDKIQQVKDAIPEIAG